jgi:hypothetical protein
MSKINTIILSSIYKLFKCQPKMNAEKTTVDRK